MIRFKQYSDEKKVFKVELHQKPIYGYFGQFVGLHNKGGGVKHQ